MEVEIRMRVVRRRFNINISGSVGQRVGEDAHSAPHSDSNYYSIYKNTCMKCSADSYHHVHVTLRHRHVKCFTPTMYSDEVNHDIFPDLCLRQLLLLIHCFFFPLTFMVLLIKVEFYFINCNYFNWSNFARQSPT